MGRCEDLLKKMGQGNGGSEQNKAPTAPASSVNVSGGTSGSYGRVERILESMPKPYVSYADFGQQLLDRVNVTGERAKKLVKLLDNAPAAIALRDQTLRRTEAEADSIFKSGAWKTNPLVSDMLMEVYNRRSFSIAKVEQMKAAYGKLQEDANRAVQENRAAIEDYNGFYGLTQDNPTADQFRVGSGAAWDTWRGSVRKAEDIKPELAKAQQMAETARKLAQAAQSDVMSAEGMVTAHGENSGLEERRSAYSRTQEAAEEAEKKVKLLQEELDYSKYLEWEDLRGNQDFAEKSGYVPTGEVETYTLPAAVSDSGFVTSQRTGYKKNGVDLNYEYINGNRAAASVMQSRESEPGEYLFGDGDYLRYMTEDEKSLYNYVHATQGKERADEYLEYLKITLTARQREAYETDRREYASAHPVMASVETVATAPARGISYIGQGINYLRDGKIDQNAAYNRFSYGNSAIRDEVAKKIEESGKWGKAGSFLYQTGMSMGDFLMTAAVSGGNEALSLAIMGSGAAADSVIEAKDRGLSDGQAFALGTIAGAAEILTERVSLETLLDKTSMGRSAVGYFLKNILAEGSEEAASDIINWTADVLIAQDKSQWRQAIEGYKAQGMSENAAFIEAMKDKAAEIGLDALGGALSGGVMAAPGTVGAAINNNRAGSSVNWWDETTVRGLIDEARNLGDSPAYKAADALEKKINAGRKISRADVGGLINLTQQARAEKTGRAADGDTDAGTPRETGEEKAPVLQKKGPEETEQGAGTQKPAYESSASKSSSEEGGIPAVLRKAFEEAGISVSDLAENDVQEEMTLAERRFELERRERAVKERITRFMQAQSRGEDTGGLRTELMEEADAIERERRNIEQAEAAEQRRAEDEAFRAQRTELTVAPTGTQIEERRERVANLRELERSGRESGATEEQIESARRISDATGRRVVFVNEGSAKRGAYKSGTIYVNAAYGDEMGQIVAHELTHSIEDSEDYRAFSSLVQRRIMETGGDLDEMLREVRERYAAAGVELDSKRGDDMKEVVAEFVERELLTNEESITSLVRENRSLGRRILDLLNKLLAKLGVRSSKEKDFLRSARDLYARALVETRSETAGRAAQQAALEEALRALAAGEITDEEFDRIFDALGIETVEEEGKMKHSVAAADRRERAGALRQMLNSGASAQDIRRYVNGLADKGAQQNPAGTRTGGARQIIDAAHRANMSVDEYLRQNWDEYEVDGQLSAEARRALELEGGRQYSVKRDTQNRPFVEIDRDILAGVPESERIKTVKNNLSQRFPNGVPVRKDVIKVNSKTRGEITESKYSQWLRDNAPDVYADKFRATDNLDEIVLAAQNWKGEGLKHPRTDSIIEFARGDVRLKVGANDYEADVVVATTKSGEMVLYDIVSMKPTQIAEKNISPTAATTDNNVSLRHRTPERRSDGNVPQKSGNVKTQFSIAAPVERTDTLIAVHNMDEEKLRRTLTLGAWPSPSIAVVEAEQGHDMYGDYSAVFPRSTVDPEADSRNRVYGSDAWTPTHDNARVDYEVNYDRLRQIENRIHELSRNVAGGIFANGSVLRAAGIENETTDDLNAVARKLAGKDAVKAAYLADRGTTLEPEYKTKEYDRAGNKFLQDVINTLGEQRLAAAVVSLETTGRLDDSTAKELRGLYRNMQLERMTEGHGKTKTVEAIRERAEMFANRLAENRLEDFVRNAWQMYQEGGGTTEEIDRMATRDKLVEAAPDRDVEAWVLEQIEGLLGEPGIYNGEDYYDSKGNRKSFSRLHWPVSAENIVRAMNNAEERGANMMGYGGAEGLLATATPEYRNVEEMHADEGRLRQVPEEEYKQRMEALDRELEDVIRDIMRSTAHHSVNTYEEQSILSYTISQAAGTDRSRNAIRRAFATEGYTITPAQAQAVAELLKHALQMPTGYFEAKPQRVVSFDEAVAVAAPDNAPEDLLSQMRGAGMNVVTYKTGDRQSRIDVLNSLDGARFSIAQEETQEETRGDVRETIPAKARAELERAERDLVNKAGTLLNVPQLAQRKYLADIAAEISREFLTSGKISEETTDRLFETAYSKGVQVDREFYDHYKELKKRLKESPVFISEKDRANVLGFDNFASFRRAAFGTLRIVNDGGTPVDMAYEELSGEYPELFPEDITDPGAQILRMYEVGNSIRISEKSLDEAYGKDAGDFRKWAKNDFNSAVGDMLARLRTVKRYAEDRAASGKTEGAALTLEEVKALYPKARDARKAYEKVNAKNLLTAEDQRQVGRLMRGDIELSDLKPERDNVRGITEVYRAKEEYEQYARQIREWNNARKESLRQEADEYLKTANGWKDKKGWQYSRETMERNVRDIVPDAKLANRIVKAYFTPIHEAAAKSTKLKNRMRERVRALNLSRKAAEGNTVSEAHAVQLLGEAMDNIDYLTHARTVKQRDGKSLSDWRGVVQNLYASNPNMDWDKIKGAVDEFRKIYNELFEMMNDSRVRNGYEPVAYRRGYFPHFQPGEGDGIISLFGKALGISTEVTALPTTINGLTHTFRPGIQWFGNALERTGFNTAYDAVEGFDKYIEGVADVIYQTENIQKLRALASQTRYRTSDEGLREQVDEIRADTTLQEQDKENRIKALYESGRYTLSNFVVELEEYTNLLANKKSRADRNMEQALGRNMYNLVKTLEGRVAANMVGINMGSWLTNFIPLTQGWSMLSSRDLLKGMGATLKAYKIDDGIVDMSTFLTNRRGSDPLVRTWHQKASATTSKPMEWIDNFTADSLVRARYQQNLNRGMSEAAAMEEADSWVAGVMADRSKGGTPTLFNRSNPLTKLFTQFQLEVNNQLSFVCKDMPWGLKNKGLGALALALFKFALGAWLYDEVYEYFIGRRPALDPIGLLNDTVGDLTGYELPNLISLGAGAVTGNMPSFKTGKAGIGKAGANLAESVAEEMPFVGGLLGGGRLPVSSALPNIQNLWGAATNSGQSGRKRWNTAVKEIGKPLTYLLLPFGGGQMKKILEGVSAVVKGGSYTVDSKGRDIMQYPIYNDSALGTAGNVLRASLFGKSSFPGAQRWVDSEFKNYSAKATGAYQGLTKAGIRGLDADDLIIALTGAEKTEDKSEKEVQIELLRKSTIPEDIKLIPYYALMASDSEIKLIDELAGNGVAGELLDMLLNYDEAGALKEGKSDAQRKAVFDSKLTDNEKIKAIGILESSTSYTSFKMSTAQKYGISMKDYYAGIYGAVDINGDGKVTQEDKISAIDRLNLSSEKKAVLYQLADSGWKPKNNPFDPDVGQKVYDTVQAEKKRREEGETEPEEEKTSGARWEHGRLVLPKVGESRVLPRSK